MSLPSNIHKIKQLIANGETEEAISFALMVFEESQNIYNKLILLSADFHRWENNELLGISSDSTAINRINLAIIRIIEKEGKKSHQSSNASKLSKITSSTFSPYIPKKLTDIRKKELLLQLITNEKLKNEVHPIIHTMQNIIINGTFEIGDTIESIHDRALKQFYTVEKIDISTENIEKIFISIAKSGSIAYSLNKVQFKLDGDHIIVIVNSNLQKDVMKNELINIAEEICRHTRKYFKISVEKAQDLG